MKRKSHKLLRNSKSQAALEFLTTYGWAFLVILIMIGALAYFGILRPSRLLPDRCSFGPELECQDFQIAYGTGADDGTVKIKLKNNIGEAISIATDGLTVSTESATALICTGDPTITGVWTSGEIRDFTFSGCNSDAVGFVAGDKGKVSIALGYFTVRSGSGYTHQVAGEIFATVT